MLPKNEKQNIQNGRISRMDDGGKHHWQGCMVLAIFYAIKK
jgi:hypothetical protein